MTDTTTYNRHLPPETFALDVVDEINRWLGPLDDELDGAADNLLDLEVNGRTLGDWIAIGFAAVAARQAQLDSLNTAVRWSIGDPSLAEARAWFTHQSIRLTTLIGDLPQ